jgi:hypothetical protein
MGAAGFFPEVIMTEEELEKVGRPTFCRIAYDDRHSPDARSRQEDRGSNKACGGQAHVQGFNLVVMIVNVEMQRDPGNPTDLYTAQELRCCRSLRYKFKCKVCG